MNVNTLTILDTTIHGIPSGNYDGSSLDFDSDGAKGVGIYRGQGSIQTVYQRIAEFEGVITIQATLDQLGTDARWVDVYTYSDGSTVENDFNIREVIGNYTWLRAHVTDFTAGTINFINVSY